ncbi:hypothetical protein NDU88_000662 [Pleurodeles waltl]|uniref:Uncharacterized protein n=1 Tax=Pleurodeles waltl TaxID=8319 RepID=A0AAV7SX57_PLEWA|nr:hypothetical protein NDU88_000662 [Pleurodeles waltl]
MKTPLVIGRDVPTETVRTYIENSGQMVCYQANPMVLCPGSESQSFFAEKIRPHSSLFVYIPHRSSVVRQDLNRPTVKGREEGLESQTWQQERLSLRKVADRSPPSKIRCSVSGDPYRFLETPFVLKPLPAEAPLKSPHVPACMSDQQNARSEQTEQTKDVEDSNDRSILEHWNQRLNVLNPLRRRKGLIQCCVQYCPYEQEALRGLQVRLGHVHQNAQLEQQLGCRLQLTPQELRRLGFD